MSVSLGTFIRERRQDLGLTQEQLAERVGPGVRQAEISRLERDHVMLPHRARMEALAAALEVSLGDLFVQTGWLDAEHLDTLPTLGGDPPAYMNDQAALTDTIHQLHEVICTATDELAQAEAALDELVEAKHEHHDRATDDEGAAD